MLRTRLESLWLVKTDRGAYGMDFRVSFVNVS